MSTVVLASAGTGKTWSLVDAWLRAALGLDGADTDGDGAPRAVPAPESLCAITFTEKAAAEMRARIEQRLATLRFAPADEPALAEAIAAQQPPRWTDETLDTLRRAVGRAPIGTFHALCARLLREHAIAAAIDPSFRILEPDDEQRMLHEIGEGVVLDALADGDDATADLVARLPLRGLFEQRGFVEGLVAVWSSLAEQGIDAASVAPAQPLLSIDAALQHVEAAIGDAEAQVAQPSTSKAVRASVPPRLTKARLWLQLLTKAKRGPADDGVVVDDGSVVEAYLGLRDEFGGSWGGASFTDHRRALVDATAGLGAALVDDDAAMLAPAVRELLMEVDSRQRREKDQRGVLGFGDLMIRCRDLLRDDRSVRARVKGRFARIFVDEYQDTSPAQEQLLALLAEAPARGDALVASQPLQAMRIPLGRLFIVGDPKQSIYGFRGADAAVFSRAVDAVVSRGGQRRQLGISRRSDDAVCRFVNIVTAQALPAHSDETLTALRPQVEANAAGAWWQAAGALAASALPTVEIEAAIVADRLISEVLQAGHRPSDILILTRRSRSTAVFGRALSRRGVGVRVVGGDGFWRRPEILDVVSALALTIDPRDELAALTVLRSPLVGLTDDGILALFEAMPTLREGFSWSKIIEAADDELVPRDGAERIRDFNALLVTVRTHLATMPVSSLIDTIVDDGGYAVACAAERDADLRLRHLEKLRAMAAGRSENGVLGIARLVDAIDDPPAESVAFDAPAGDDAVRIMTIHQSKGLEANVVVLADAGLALRANGDDVCFGPGVGLSVSPRGRPMARCAPKASATSTTTLQRARKSLRQRDEAELARLLYVAITRARRAVFIVGAPRRRGTSSMLGLLQAARAASPDEFDAVLPTVAIDAIDDTLRYVGPTAPRLPDDGDGDGDAIDDDDDTRPPVAPTLRVRASALAARATAQLTIGLGSAGGFDMQDDDIIPPRARGRLAHAIIGLVATELADVLDNDDNAVEAAVAAAVVSAEHAVGSPPGAIDDALRDRIIATLVGPVRRLRAEGRQLRSEVPSALVVDGVVVEGTADLVASGRADVVVVELKLSMASARAEATTIQVLACCAGLEQGGLDLPLRYASWAIGEQSPPPHQPFGKPARRQLAGILARVTSGP